MEADAEADDEEAEADDATSKRATNETPLSVSNPPRWPAAVDANAASDSGGSTMMPAGTRDVHPCTCIDNTVAGQSEGGLPSKL